MPNFGISIADDFEVFCQQRAELRDIRIEPGEELPTGVLVLLERFGYGAETSKTTYQPMTFPSIT